MAYINHTKPYKATSQVVNWFLPIRPVANGSSESQKRRVQISQLNSPVCPVDNLP